MAFFKTSLYLYVNKLKIEFIMFLTTKVHINEHNRDGIDTKVLRQLCYHCARLYNVGLYNVRQHYFNTGQYLTYNGSYKEAKPNENYALLLTDIGQQVLRLVDRDFHSFFNLLLLKKSGRYSEKVRLPHYKDKEGLMACPVMGRSVRIKNGKVKIGLTKEFRELYGISYSHLYFTIPQNLKDINEFKELRIVPLMNGNEFDVEFVYESREVRQIPQDADGYLSIDLGLDNLMACSIFSNGESHQYLIDGRKVKAINAYYNKMKSKLQAEYSKNKSIEGLDTRRMRRLSNGRRNRINDYLNRAVNKIVDLCFQYNVKTVVIGYNKEMKQGINIGRVNNQNFVSIPYLNLRSKLQSKCELHGIVYAPQEESYTSKASSIDLDVIPVYDVEDKTEYAFSGKRVKRGLYRSKEGLLLNADINGSVNILRKYIKECNLKELSSDRIRALVNAPCQRIRL